MNSCTNFKLLSCSKNLILTWVNDILNFQLIVKKVLISHPKSNLPVTVSMSRVQTSSSRSLRHRCQVFFGDFFFFFLVNA